MIRTSQEPRQGCTGDWTVVAAKLQSQASSKTTRQPAYQSQTCGDWVVVAAELPSQPSSQAIRRPAHGIQTPSSQPIGTPVGQQDSQNDSHDTDMSFDNLQTSDVWVLRFPHFSPPRADGSRKVTREPSLDRTVSPTPSRRLWLRLDRIQVARQETIDSEWKDVGQGGTGSVAEGN